MSTYTEYTTEQIEQGVADALCTLNITINTTQIPRRTDGVQDWHDTAVHWSVCIQKHGHPKPINIEYSQGVPRRVWGKRVPGNWKGQFHTKPVPGGAVDPIRQTVWANEQIASFAVVQPPSPADILSCLFLDGTATEYSFQDWADEYGLSSDSIKARDMWIRCVELGHELKHLFGQSRETLSDMLSQY